MDECHHVPAVSFERALSNVKAKYVTGLTATLQRLLARMFEKRLRGYCAIGYEHATLPPGYSGPSSEPVIELDEAVPGYEDL